jgi:hypothetical protein
VELSEDVPLSKPSEDRRAHPRYPAKIEMQGTPEEGGVVARMTTTDLSLGGLYCVSATDFPEMTRLAVRLMLPRDGTGNETHPLDIEAVVVRREPLSSPSGEPRFELALFFTNLENGDKEILSRVLNGSRAWATT